MTPPHYLIDDVLFSRSPQQLGDDVVQRLRVSAAIRPVKEADPPVFHPVRVHAQEQHEAVQICAGKHIVVVDDVESQRLVFKARFDNRGFDLLSLSGPEYH